MDQYMINDIYRNAAMDYQLLDTYDAECRRGLCHNDAYKQRMEGIRQRLINEAHQSQNIFGGISL